MAVQKFPPVVFEQEPKRKNRFVFEFPPEFSIEPWKVQRTDKPSFNIVNGKLIWQPIHVGLIDLIGPSTSRMVMEYIAKLKELKPNTFILKSLDPTGVPVEEWKMLGCTINSVKFGTLDYDTDELQTVTLEIAMKSATLS